ncbi:MAG TPA: TonB-dependent receptor [Verrucomicrobiae bacterium]|jgi:Tfp pilus assembly protein PilF|nr:TonB-dependent receptor [Verrucomicrobiae bacterium]
MPRHALPTLLLLAWAFRLGAAEPVNEILAVEGAVETTPPGAPVWSPARPGQHLAAHYQLRTGARSRAAIRLSDLSVLRVGELMQYEMIPAASAGGRPALDLKRGTAYFFSRDKPDSIQLETPVVAGAIRGTEFNVTVAADGATELTMFDGRVDLSNEHGSVALISGEQGRATAQTAPARTAILNAVNIIQWTLYYPGALDPAELALPEQDASAIAASLQAYAAGDLPEALRAYPADRKPAGASEKAYFAGLLLSAGLVEKSQAELSSAGELPLARAVAEVTAAAKFQVWGHTNTISSASEWLAESYYLQSRSRLAAALEAARRAVEKSPSFALGWERVAELEFSFGRTPASERALTNALRLGPRNARAQALLGFLRLAGDRAAEAEAAFSRALAMDPMLGEAWLGRGLGRIHAGHAAEGRADLETAVTLEPNRSIFRSYLGKAYANQETAMRNPALRGLALAELAQAKQRDPNDPTPWLYSALILYNEYRDADAIDDLKKSETLNDNRQVYRSRLLLDQDQAVRSANLANIYKDAGMVDVSLAEAAQAAAFDYGNFSAHLNLASTFDELRDPTRFNLRYESAWFNEQLLASMLAPLGAVSLSQNLSQQEYSRLFESPHLGFYGTGEYFSDGEYRQTATQYGTEGPVSYALDLDYDYKRGDDRVNNDLSRIEWYTRVKYQVAPRDSLFLLTKYQDYDAGDQFQYYDPSLARPAFRFSETQTPLLLAGWHHEWGPGSHTLFLAGRLENNQHFSDTNANQLVQQVSPLANPTTVLPFDVVYDNAFQIYTAELNQIVQRERHTDIFGARYQEGDFQSDSVLYNPQPAALAALLHLPSQALSSQSEGFGRFSAYEYHHWEIVDGLMLIGGAAYDAERYPANYRRPPLAGGDKQKDQLSPKGALIWKAAPDLTLRAVYSAGLGGVSYDESVRLEPTQLAGFDQTFRSLVSESLIGSIEAPRFELAGGAADWMIGRQTWLTLQGSLAREQVDSQFGYFTVTPFAASPALAANALSQNDYTETTIRATVNQIVAREWFLQAQYQFSRSKLRTTLPDIAALPGFQRVSTQEGDLHQTSLSATWQSPQGWFARGETDWYAQSLFGDAAHPTGQDFVQFNVFAGYRFRNRRAEITIGGLNLTGGDYHLQPINYYLDLPHGRLFYTRVRFSF